MARILDLDDGFSTSTNPDQGDINSTRAKAYASRTLFTTFLTDNGITLAEGHWYYNTTSKIYEFYDGVDWHALNAFSIAETGLTIVNNQSTPTDVTGLICACALFTSMIVVAEIKRRTDATEVGSAGLLIAFYYPGEDTWLGNIIDQLGGDDTGVVFTITAAGQIQYTSSNIAGANYVGNMKFKVLTLNV